ncbi:MAG: alpha/beta hydrolase [Pseudomonadota bacterium]
MPDYDTLLDAEVHAFLARTSSFYPDDATDLSIAEQRRHYDRMCAAFEVPHPPGLSVQDRTLGGVPCRIYTPAAARGATILFCHGGGFVVGGLDSHDSLSAELSAGAGARLVAIDYSLSPEHPFPQDFADVLAVFAALEGALVLCGDSAGGNLVAALAHATRASGRVLGQVLIYPALGGARDLPSYVQHAHAPGLTVQDMDFYEGVRRACADVTADARFAPLADTDFSGLPETLIVTAQYDPLSSDGQAYAAALTAAGGQAEWVEEAGLVHGYLRARHMSAKAGASVARIIGALRRMTQS